MPKLLIFLGLLSTAAAAQTSFSDLLPKRVPWNLKVSEATRAQKSEVEQLLINWNESELENLRGRLGVDPASWLALLASASKTFKLAKNSQSRTEIESYLQKYLSYYANSPEQNNRVGLVYANYKIGQALKPMASPLNTFTNTYLKRPNFAIIVSESYLKDQIETVKSDSGSERSRVSGVLSSSSFHMDGVLSLETVPSANNAVIKLTLVGKSNSKTHLDASNADISLRGNHEFMAHKNIVISNGRAGSQATSIPYGGIKVWQQITGVQTDISRRPILGALFGKAANKSAYKKVQNKKWQINQSTANSISKSVKSLMDKEVNQKLAQFNSRISSTYEPRVKEANISVSFRNYFSFDQGVGASYLLGTKNQLGSFDDHHCSLGATSFGLAAHESFLNNYLEQKKYAKRVISKLSLRKELTALINVLLGKKVEKAATEDSRQGFELYHINPLEVRLMDGKLIVNLKLKLPEFTAFYDVLIPVSLSGKGSSIIVRPGHISARLISGAVPRKEQIGQISQLRTELMELIPFADIEFKSFIGSGNSARQLMIQEVEMRDGWFCLDLLAK